MDVSENPGGIDQLHQLLLCFQCQRVPFDLITRACKPKSSWSATGEPEQIQPHEGGVPQWLLDLWETRQWPFGHADDAAAPGFDGLRFINDCGIRYLEIQASPANSLEASNDEQSQEAYISQCIRIFNHAFPCRNTEVLGEEIAARLVPLAKAFVLPLLASASERQIRHWLPPSERKVLFSITLFDCLLQVFTYLGPYSPLNPTSFPRKVLNAIDIPVAQGHEVEPCLKVVLGMIDTISSPSLESFERFALNSTSGDLDERSNAWFGLTLRMLLSSGGTKRSQPQALSDAILKAAASWNPKSTTDTSPIEYLVAIELLPHARLRNISLPEPLTVSIELSIIRGLLLSRMQYYDEASRVLYNHMPASMAYWGIASFQIGIAAAESANCYNMLRKEDIANKIATRCLAVRNTPELIGRQDWFYLSLYLVDSLIGSGKYTEAESTIQNIIIQPTITPTIHMMCCLRLSKICRRISAENGPVEFYHSLHEGLGLFLRVPGALQEEYLEEAACSLSATATTTRWGLEAQEALIDGINTLVGQAGLRKSPAQKRYSQAEFEFKQHLRKEASIIVPGHELSQDKPVTPVNDDTATHSGIGFSSIIDVGAAPIAIQRVSSIPYERDEAFVPRPELTKEMHRPLFKLYEGYEWYDGYNDAIPITELGETIHRQPNFQRFERLQVYSIYGEVGIGKTSFVTDFVYTVQDFFEVIIWIRNASKDKILDYLSSIAVRLELTDAESSTLIHPDQALEELFKWFRRPRITDRERPWLMVFDGIEDEEVLRQIWPNGGQLGAIIVITRKYPLFLAGWNIGLDHGFELRHLDPGDAEKLIFKLLLDSRGMAHLTSGKLALRSGQITTKAARSLADLLQYHPGAIKQAAALISESDMSEEIFIQTYKATQETYLSPLAINEILRHPNHNLALITIWLIRASRKDLFFLYVICLLSGVGTDEILLYPDKFFVMEDDYPQNVSEFAKTRDQLLESSLIWKNHWQHTLCTSTTVQAIFRERMSPSSFQAAFYRALLLLFQSWPCKFRDLPSMNYGLSTHPQCSKLWPHVDNLCEKVYELDPSNIPPSEDAQILEALLSISWCAIIRGAHHYASLFLDLTDRTLGAHTSGSRSFRLELARQRCLLNHHRGRLAHSQGLYEEAATFFRRSFVLAVKELSPGSETYWSIQAAAQHGLGDTHRKAGSIEASIVSYEMSIKALSHTREKFEKYLSTVRLSLGLSLLLNERPKAAERVLEQARLSKSTPSLGDKISDPSRNLALILSHAIAKLVQGKAEESLQLALECLNSPSSSGQESRKEGFIHLVISSSYGRLSQFDPAMERLDQAIAAFMQEPDPSWLRFILGEQRRLYDLMRRGARGSLELQTPSDFFDEGGFLNMHFFATHGIHDISHNL